jgi:hypothetical protein
VSGVEKRDVILMASHGRRGVSAIVLGSETVKVLTHSTIPVVMVRGQSPAAYLPRLILPRLKPAHCWILRPPLR